MGGSTGEGVVCSSGSGVGSTASVVFDRSTGVVPDVRENVFKHSASASHKHVTMHCNPIEIGHKQIHGVSHC